MAQEGQELQSRMNANAVPSAWDFGFVCVPFL